MTDYLSLIIRTLLEQATAYLFNSACVRVCVCVCLCLCVYCVPRVTFCCGFVLAMLFRRIAKVGYKTQWLSRALLLSSMHRAGVRVLRGAGDVSLAHFAQAFPDSKAWFSKLTVRGEHSSLQAFMESLNYTGRPEFFSMFACLLGNAQLCKRADWFAKHCRALRAEMQASVVQNGFMGVPSVCVKAVHSQTMG